MTLIAPTRAAVVAHARAWIGTPYHHQASHIGVGTDCLGLIRGVKGVVIGQLLIAIVGIGHLFERYSRGFLMAEFWALLMLVFAFAFALSEAVGFFERRVAVYATSR